MKPYPGNFIHGIDLNNGYPCWNLSLSGKLYSPDFVAAVDPGVFECHKSIRDTDLELIQKGYMPHGAYTPRGIWFIQAAYQTQIGEYNKWSARGRAHFSVEEADSIFKMGGWNSNLRKDAVRLHRTQLLDCHAYMSQMTVNKADHTCVECFGFSIHIIKVTIPLAIRVTKCDTHWFDAYWKESRQDYIDKYWPGECKYKESPTWEYLVDGMIEVNDPEGMEYLREHGTNIALQNP